MQDSPVIFTVDILPIAKKSNVKTEIHKRKVKKLVKKPKYKVKKKPVSVKSKPKKKKNEIAVPKEEKPKIIKKKPKKIKSNKPKSLDNEFEDILKDIKKDVDSEKEKSATLSDSYNESMPLSLSQTDNIKSQIMRYWYIDGGAKDSYKLNPTIKITVNKKGEILTAQLIASEKYRYRSNSFFRAATDSAIRAVYKSSPLKNLPMNKYETWRKMEISFNPKDVLY